MLLIAAVAFVVGFAVARKRWRVPRPLPPGDSILKYIMLIRLTPKGTETR